MIKKKIFNDPVYGFINIPDGLIFDLIEHPRFQRLRRIKQLGLNDYVYPGALHTRFHHAIGAMHLMKVTLNSLMEKGIEISEEELEASMIAILLHDIGHGPFSHSLEHTLLKDTGHELISSRIMEWLDDQFQNKLSMTLEIFKGRYPKKFLNQLVSSQLDIDRLDYLSRDSFFTGVSEGTIGAERIIKMLSVHDNELVVEEKGIYSIENFLIARRLMYWQVYLHKTAISAEKILVNLMNRARFLIMQGETLSCPDYLRLFLEADISMDKLTDEVLDQYCMIDDFDIWNCIKSWQFSKDSILSDLCGMLINRRLFKVEILTDPPSEERMEKIRRKIINEKGCSEEETKYYFSTGEISNEAYMGTASSIRILTKKGKVKDVAEASDLPNIKAISKIVKKYYLCWPKPVSL